MSCRTGCREGGHRSWGECARAAGIQIDRHSLTQDAQLDKKKDHRLNRYAQARSDGLQPKSTRMSDINAAFETGGAERSEVTAAVNATPQNYSYDD